MPSTGLGHAWIMEEVERVEDLCYTCKTESENVHKRMRKITKKTNLKLRKLCKTTN